MKAKRDAADREVVERKRREDAALERYAEAVAAGVAVEEELARELAALERRREELQAAAERRKAEAAGEAGAALAEIVALPGRSVEEVAGWVDLPVKRVRRMARGSAGGAPMTAAGSPSQRPAASVPAVAVSGAAEAPEARPVGSGSGSGGPDGRRKTGRGSCPACVRQHAVDRQELSALAHSDPIAAPVSDGTVRHLLGRAIRRPDAHLLDLGCGTGAWLLHALRTHPGVTAVGVDISDKGFGRTRAAAADFGAAGRLELRCEDVTAFQPTRKADVVLSVGAAHAFGGLLTTLDATRNHLAEGGVVLVGDGFWEGEPDAAVRAELEDGPQRYADLPTTIARIEDHGWTPVYGHVSTREEWDDYEWSWTGSLTQWALDHPRHPDHDQALKVSAAHRDSWLNGYRGIFGFFILLLRQRNP